MTIQQLPNAPVYSRVQAHLREQETQNLRNVTAMIQTIAIKEKITFNQAMYRVMSVASKRPPIRHPDLPPFL